MTADRQRREIEEFIAAHGGRPAVAATRGRDGRGTTATAPEPIAIVGLAGYFPSCLTHHEFWRVLDEDRSVIEDVPVGRFTAAQAGALFDPQLRESAGRWGGFIPDIESFDREFFGISRAETELLDPQLRLLLMAVYRTIEDAGYAPCSLRNSRTGVFVGFERNEYRQLLTEGHGVEVPDFAGADAMIANQISYRFDLRGPSETVNATCAGGAIALHRAVRAIRSGEIDQAVVGAVNVMLNPGTFAALVRMGQLSAEPTVRSFGKGATGYLRGEAVASVLLKRLTRAEADNDPIYALIRNSATNFNGRGGTSIAAPNIASHVELISQCYRESAVDPRRITYIEAQGMGSRLTDLAEWEAYNRALDGLAKERGSPLPAGNCLISTLKPMTGHMHAASGLGALFKIIRSLQTGRVHKILGFDTVNPALDLENRPCRLALETDAWTAADDRPRLAGLHSYGASGSNAHLLIEEYRDQIAPSPPQRAVGVLPFSARKPDELRKSVCAVWEELQRQPGLSLAGVAATMQRGRDEMACRVAFVADCVPSLIGAAASWLDAGAPVGVHYLAAAEPVAEAIAQIAAQWVAGGSVEWPGCGQFESARRLHLPVYPFAVGRCWYDAAAARPASVAGEAADIASLAKTEAIVRGLLGDFLNLDSGSLDLNKQFSELGFNSTLVTEFSTRLAKQHAISLSPAALFAQTSPAGLVRQIAGMRGDGPAERDGDPVDGAGAPARRPAPQSDRARGDGAAHAPIAIVGLAGTYPDAPDLSQFWHNLSHGIDSIKALPLGRWPASAHHEPDRERALRSRKYYAHRGGFLDGIDGFDWQFFNIAPAEAEYMHVKERLFMQCAWHAVEDAGYTPASLRDETVGVFVGVSKAGLDSYKDSFFSLANRVSYRFNFSGPSMPVDTACSSSLSALHVACLHIHGGDCTVAIVGGVNAYTHPSTFAEFSRLGVMSPDGATRAFGDLANGFAPGEGVGA